MNLKQSLITYLLMMGCFSLLIAQTPSFPWLDGVISDNCCSNQTATAYDFGVYSFVYIEANENCTTGGKLYYEDGTCWCVDTDGSFCLTTYGIVEGSGEVIYNCEGATNFTPFDQFEWLSGVANAQDCAANPAITVYLKNGEHFVHVVESSGGGRLYSNTGSALCTDQLNYSCTAAYGLTAMDQTLSWSCGDGSTPLTEGVEVVLRNTLQDPEEAEATYASLFGAADEAFDEFATLSNSTVEFPTALSQNPSTGAPFDISGLYEIDLTENSISFAVLPDESDPFWVNVFGLFPEGKVDRYYFTFSEPHNITSFTSDNPFLNVRIDSETVIVVELTGGYDLKPGVAFSVDLK